MTPFKSKLALIAAIATLAATPACAQYYPPEGRFGGPLPGYGAPPPVGYGDRRDEEFEHRRDEERREEYRRAEERRRDEQGPRFGEGREDPRFGGGGFGGPNRGGGGYGENRGGGGGDFAREQQTNQQILGVQQQRNQQVLSLEQQFNAGRISRQQLNAGTQQIDQSINNQINQLRGGRR